MEKDKLIDDFTDEDKIEANTCFHDFHTNKELLGVMIRFEKTDFGFSPVLENEDGEIWVGSYTALKGKFSEEDIGKKIKIVFLGQEKGKSGRLYMKFDIYKKEIK